MRDERPTTIGALLRLARKQSGRSGKEMAAAMKVSANTISNYEVGNRQPDIDFLASFALLTGESFARLLEARLVELGISLDYIVSGGDRGPPVATSVAKPTSYSPEKARVVPVIGLVECGLEGWYRREDMAVAATAPPDLTDPDAFAVIAVGISMVPEGVLAGHLCICSPAATPAPGDLVYLEERNGNASLKIFDGADAEWIEFRSYLPPDEAGSQAPYIDKRTRASLARVATVVYVKRRL